MTEHLNQACEKKLATSGSTFCSFPEQVPRVNESKKALVKECTALLAEAEKTALTIADYSELSMEETRSADLLKHILQSHGFEITREFPLVPNAFVASFGQGQPIVGLLAEYDALPDCGPDGQSPGHGCGHNLLGSASTFAAIALARVMAARNLPGTVRLFGCPAEETLVGKVYMARDGAFDGLDACLAWHPSTYTHVNKGSGTAMDSVTYEFFGKTAHAAGDPHLGRSALDAVEIMNVAVNYLREHVPPEVRMHYAIMDGGKAPNVVPPYARSWYFVRGKNREQVAEVARRVDDCARAGALATGTEMKRTFLTAAYDRLANDAIIRAMDSNLRLVGGPLFTEEDQQFIEQLGIDGKLSGAISPISTANSSGSSDEANVSWIAPLGRISVACWASGTPGHHTLVHQQSVSPAAMKGLAVAIKTLALTGFDLLNDADLLAQARKEFRERTQEKPYDPLIPPGQPAPVHDRIPDRPLTI